MRIFADLHHYELFYSMQLLFENRLGLELYRPIGMEWYEQKYWNVFPHPDTAGQYLGIHHGNKRPKDIHGNELPDNACVNLRYHIEDGIYYCADSTKPEGVFQRGVTLDKFKEMEFDVLLSSIPQHIDPYNRLIQQYQPKAKHVFQVGNAWTHLPGVKNLLVSAAPFPTPPGVNSCFYHQEFDLGVFKYEPPTVRDKVGSYIHYMQKVDLMNQFASAFPNWTFKTYGAGMDENIGLTKDVAQTMIDSAFTWHFKPEGDGYGHIIHNTYACGRPPIIWAPFYQGKLANALFEDGVNCIDISKRDFADNVMMIHKYSQPEEHDQMCRNARARFNDVVNFEAEGERVKTFLENLI